MQPVAEYYWISVTSKHLYSSAMVKRSPTGPITKLHVAAIAFTGSASYTGTATVDVEEMETEEEDAA